MTNEPKPAPIDPPAFPWVHRLPRGCPIWLTKEGKAGEVKWPWYPPQPDRWIGSLVLQHPESVHIYEWYVDDHGCGIDGSQILQPCFGCLPEKDCGLWIDGDRRALHNLHDEVDDLKRRVKFLEHLIYTSGIRGWQQLHNRVGRRELAQAGRIAGFEPSKPGCDLCGRLTCKGGCSK